MRSDDEITREIMEASLGGLGLAAGIGAVAGAAKGLKVASDTLGATKTGGRIKGAVMATNAYTRLKADWSAYRGANIGGRNPSSVQELTTDLQSFFTSYYGFDASPQIAQAMQDLGLDIETIGGSHGGDAEPNAAPNGGSPASPAGPAPKTGDAPAAQPSQTAQPAQQPQAQAQAQAQPQNDAARRAKAQQIARDAMAKYPNGVPEPGGEPKADTKDGENVVNRERPFYRHDSSRINFDDADLRDPSTNPWSSKRARDEAKLGNENPGMAAPRTKPARKKRNESIEPTSLTFSQIIAEAETSSTARHPVLSHTNGEKIALQVLKTVARRVASNPRAYQSLMSGNGLSGAAQGHGQSQGKPGATAPQTTWNNPRSNNTTSKTIDRAAVNAILTRDLHMNVERIEEIEREVRGLNPDDSFKKLRQVVTQDEALRIVTALLKTVEK